MIAASELTYNELPQLSGVMTGENLFDMGDIGHSELVRGKLAFMSPTGYIHGIVEVDIASVLRDFVRRHKLGKVLGGEVGIYTQRNPDTVRGADVAFISYQRLSKVKSPNYLDIAPELVVEILSPNNRWGEISEKIDEYFAIGVQIVWIADPKHRQIFAYSSPTILQRFKTEDRIGGGTVLPGFSASVAELFGEDNER